MLQRTCIRSFCNILLSDPPPKQGEDTHQEEEEEETFMGTNATRVFSSHTVFTHQLHSELTELLF